MSLLQTREFVFSPADLAAYQADGYLIVPRVFTAGEVAAVTADVERLLTRSRYICSDNMRCRWQNHVETGECLFDAFEGFCQRETFWSLLYAQVRRWLRPR